jgi:hypothetical protein
MRPSWVMVLLLAVLTAQQRLQDLGLAGHQRNWAGGTRHYCYVVIEGIDGHIICPVVCLAEQTMRRMIEAAELKNQRTVAPEAHSMHLTPDTDPASTFRLRNMGNRPRLDSLQFMSSPPGSTQVNVRSELSRLTPLPASLA